MKVSKKVIYNKFIKISMVVTGLELIWLIISTFEYFLIRLIGCDVLSSINLFTVLFKLLDHALKGLIF